MHTSIKTSIAVLALAAFTAAGCGSDDTGNDNSPAKDKPAPAQVDGIGLTQSQAADTQVALGRLLGEHAALAMYATQKGLDGDPDFKAIAAALDQNSVEISQVIGSVYGDAAAKEFLDGRNEWRAHINNFVSYTVATAKNDKAGQQAAVKMLGDYVTTFSTFLSKATGIDQQALADDLNAHILQLKGQLDAYAKGDYQQAYELNRGAYEHMFMTAKILAEGIGKQQGLDSGDTTAEAVGLRIALGRLLGEHAMLAQFATQKGLKGDADFKAIAASLDANSNDIGAAISSVYGDEAGKAFLGDGGQWKAHIGFFVDYTVALAKKDTAAQQKAVANLQAYVAKDSAFLAKATGASQEDLAKGLTTHILQLKGQIDAYAAGDYEKAYELERAAYAHTYMLADALAAAIADQGKTGEPMNDMASMSH
jgi:hypothetical protein